MTTTRRTECKAGDAVLCHLANIAYRVGRTIRCDPRNGHVLNDPKAQTAWSRTYEPG